MDRGEFAQLATDRMAMQFGSLFSNPRRANLAAVAATITVVAGAVLWGIFGRPIDQFASEPAVAGIIQAGRYVSREHGRCADAQVRQAKLAFREAAAISDECVSHLGIALPIAALQRALVERGYLLAGAGHCQVPGHPRSMHLIYRAAAPGSAAMVSLFVQVDEGQFWTPTVLGGWQAIELGDAVIPPVLCTSDGQMLYFLVVDEPADAQWIGARIAEALFGS